MSMTEPFAGIAPMVVNDSMALLGTPGVAIAKRKRKSPRSWPGPVIGVVKLTGPPTRIPNLPFVLSVAFATPA